MTALLGTLAIGAVLYLTWRIAAPLRKVIRECWEESEWEL